MAKPRERTRVSERRAEVARRYLQGEHQTSIARALHVTQACVSKTLKAIRQEWRESAMRDFDATREEQILKIDECEREAWTAFARSQHDSESTVRERNNGRDKVSVRVEKQVGDPRFLSVVLGCIERRVAILGLAAPQRYTINFDELSDHQLELLAAGHKIQDVLAMAVAPAETA